MEKQLFMFISNHWSLWLAFLSVLVLILINERMIQKQGPKNLSPNAVIDAMNHQDATIIDMRDTEAFRQNHIVNAQNIPNTTPEKLEKYKTKPFVLVCARGLQSSALAVKLKKQGFTQAMSLMGGIAAWKAANLPLTTSKKETKQQKAKQKQLN